MLSAPRLLLLLFSPIGFHTYIRVPAERVDVAYVHSVCTPCMAIGSPPGDIMATKSHGTDARSPEAAETFWQQLFTTPIDVCGGNI